MVSDPYGKYQQVPERLLATDPEQVAEAASTRRGASPNRVDIGFVAEENPIRR